MRVGQFTSAQGRARFAAAYAAAMALLPPPDEQRDVPTQFGTVRTYRFGTGGATPVVLLPGRGGTTAMWAGTVEGLAARRTVWSIEQLGEAGASVPSAPIRDTADQVRWLDEALAGTLGPRARAHLVGHSIGGWLACVYTRSRPRRVRSLSLLEPIRTLAPLAPSMVLASLATLLPAGRRWFVGFLAADRAVDHEDPLAHLIEVAMTDWSIALPLPTYPSDADLGALAVPVLALLGARSTVHDARRAARRARDLIVDAEVLLWPSATHGLPTEYPDAVTERLLGFLDRVEDDAR